MAADTLSLLARTRWDGWSDVGCGGGGGLLLQILLSHFAALKQPHRFTGFELMSHVILSRKKIHINCVAPNLNLI